MYPPKKILMLDDIRIRADATAIVRNVETCLKLLRYDGPWDLLLLDNDLGEFDPRAGRNVLDWLEWPENAKYRPKEVEILSQNPVERERMEVILRKIYP